ncbi:MAG: transcription termination/antitermination protein NusA [Lachnospiraceae bacterium]|nr:transcription termination/antitermination protein NusA [Lachnospiraceae bacterium]
MNKELLDALTVLEKEKDISREVIIEAIEGSLVTACRNQLGRNENIRVHMDRETGDYELYSEMTVVEEVTDPGMEISLEDAHKISPKYQVGDIVRQDIEFKSFSRIAAQNAKNVILQKLREEERKSVYDRYCSREHQIITGVIQRHIGKNISINLGKADAIMPENEQVKTENYRPTERIKVMVLKVEDTPKGPHIVVSRTHPDLVRRFFEAEVAEIKQGIVEIKAVAREAGSRTKMAVVSYDEAVDPIGACVGLNGTRVNAVVDELGGEKIDIINWSDNSAELIENALSPAKVICVLADDEEKEALVIVPDFQLSLAIGRTGQNARLAAKLTNYKIDIKSETEARETGIFDEIGYIDDYTSDDSEGEYYEEGYEEEYVEEEEGNE